MLRSNLCDYNDVHIIVKGKISVRYTNDLNIIKKRLNFKNNGNLEHAYKKSITNS